MVAWAIVGPRHAGITVSDLDRSLAFYRDLLGLELRWRRLYEEPEIRRIVGVPEATGLEIAMLRVPGSDFEVELLEYRGCDPVTGGSSPAISGTATSASSWRASGRSTRSFATVGCASAPTGRSR